MCNSPHCLSKDTHTLIKLLVVAFGQCNFFSQSKIIILETTQRTNNIQPKQLSYKEQSRDVKSLSASLSFNFFVVVGLD